MRIYRKDVYEKDYMLPYHWTMDSTSRQGIQYFGYLELVINMLSKTEVKKVLDVGCGDGILCAELVKKGFEVTGVDFSKNAINHSKRLVPKANFICADALKADALSEFQNYFDALTLIEVIEHIPPSRHLQLMKNVYKLLKKNGILILSTPSIKYPLVNEQHYKHFSLSEISQLLEDNGLFSIENIVGNHHSSFLKIEKIYRFIDNKYYDLKFIRKIFATLYRKKFMVVPLEKACRYIVKARKV